MDLGSSAATFPDVPKRKLEGAAYGSIEVQRPLRLSKDLDTAAKAAAKRERITISEWWRRAGEKALKKRGK